MTSLTMNRSLLALSLILTGFWLLVATPTPAEASPGCEHRSAAHVAEHGGIDADSAWHVAHGQLATCSDSDSGANHDDNDRRKDDGLIPHRDRPGFHCRFLVLCG